MTYRRFELIRMTVTAWAGNGLYVKIRVGMVTQTGVCGWKGRRSILSITLFNAMNNSRLVYNHEYPKSMLHILGLISII